VIFYKRSLFLILEDLFFSEPLCYLILCNFLWTYRWWITGNTGNWCSPAWFWQICRPSRGRVGLERTYVLCLEIIYLLMYFWTRPHPWRVRTNRFNGPLWRFSDPSDPRRFGGGMYVRRLWERAGDAIVSLLTTFHGLTFKRRPWRKQKTSWVHVNSAQAYGHNTVIIKSMTQMRT
jgi:hypothetical protein